MTTSVSGPKIEAETVECKGNSISKGKDDNNSYQYIGKYTKKFEAYPSDLVVFAEENNLKLLPITSMRGQALALMSQAEIRGQLHIGREEAVKFFKNIGMETVDAIQQFNKATGLKRLKMRGKYCLQYPFESDTTDLDKRRGVSISGDRNTNINANKNWLKKNLIDIPNDEWQIGHLDPTINDASEKNLAYQPPIQAKYRDRYKYGPLFSEMWPTGCELVYKPNKFYTDKEQQIIYEELRRKLLNVKVIPLVKVKMTTTLINIGKYTKEFEAYPSDLVVFAEENNLKLLPITSMRGQALALMSQAEIRGEMHIGREEAVKFFKNIGMETGDAIQQFNKATGLKRLKMRGKYCLQYPFESDTTDLDKRRGVSISGDRNTNINAIKNWWKENWIDIPNDEWQIGHLDPTINDASEKNLAYQPPIQAKYRDIFKYGPSFLEMWPTGCELVHNMDKFYTDKEQQIIYEEFKKKFEKK